MKTNYRKTKLKTMQRKQRIEKRLVQSYSRINRGSTFYERLPVLKNFNFDKRTQDWNPIYPHELDDEKLTPRFYVPDKLQSFCEYLKDLFCIEDKILLDIRYAKNNNKGTYYRKVSNDGHVKIELGARNGLRASTVIHEFIHAMGFDHEYEINDFSNFRSTCTLDTFSPLIVNDIFGRKEVLLL
jgi:hypothetical protein